MQISELVTTVGKKRFMILILLIAIGAGLGAAWQKWFIPQHLILVSEKDAVQADRVRLQTEIRELPAKYEALMSNEARYDILKAKGFLNEQDRILARTNMDNLRALTGVRGVTYDISPLEIVDHPQAYALNMNIVRSEVKVKLTGITDIEMREFVEKIQSNFSGLIVAKNFQVERAEPVNEDTLTKLSLKQPVDFAKAEASFDWYNITPKPADSTSVEAQAFGGESQ